MIKEFEAWVGLQPGYLSHAIIDVSIRIGIALVILIIGFWIAKLLAKAVERVMKKRKTDESLIGFIKSLTSIGLKTLVIVTVIAQIGVEMTSFVTILGAAGLAIGLAFSGTLSNFAGGVMILLFKPFKVSDFVNMQGEEGIVKEVLIFNTILTTLDNKIIILANGTVANGTIVNYTKAKKRRVDWVFGIAYGDDLKKAKTLLDKFIQEDDRILKEGQNFIGLGELGDSSVNITVRAWVDTNNYWPVFFDMNERVYNEFAEAGLSIPYPQMDVHIQKEG
ncbi:MAG: mechanosensitive ion channel [Crocinitomicaceae bacterium]|nr:mechanosensitive ion channel [Crocinitomicaceae bacterium]